MVEFNNEKIPLYKLIVHCVQLLFSLTIWCLEIVVFKNGEVNGRMGWTFGVVSRLISPRKNHHTNSPFSASFCAKQPTC